MPFDQQMRPGAPDDLRAGYDDKRRALRAAADERSAANHLVRRERQAGRCIEVLSERALRMAARALAARERLAPGGVAIERISMVYAEGDRHGIDVYRAAHHYRAPVIVFFYGGAWRTGSKDDFEFVGRGLARLGFVTVIGDQRLVPEVCFPAFLDDCARIVGWTQRAIGDFGGDPSRIILVGHSAGAYNAIMLALDDRYLRAAGAQLDDVRGVVGLSGPYDFYPFPLQLCADAFGAAADPLDTQPISFVRQNAPPLFIATGERDEHVPAENSVSLAAAMHARAGRCAFRTYPQASHLDPLLGLVGLDSGRADSRSDVLEFASHLALTPQPAAPMVSANARFPLQFSSPP